MTTGSAPMAIYLQDAHPITEAIEIVRYAESRVSMRCGRPILDSFARRACRWQPSPPPPNRSRSVQA